MKKINSEVQKVLRKKIDIEDYAILYKAVNARGPSNTLEDQSDFQEFISEYRKVISSGKKMLVIVTVKDNNIEKKNKNRKRVKFFIYMGALQ
jgi:hypothetical protein